MRYIIYILICVLPLQAYDITIGVNNHIMLAEGISIVSLFMIMYNKGVYAYPKFLKWIFLLIILICIGAFFTINPFAVLAKSIKLIVNVGAFIIFYNYVRRRENADRVYECMLKVSVIEAVFSIVGFCWINYIGSENFLFRIGQSVGNVNRAMGTFNDANYLGLYIACMIVMITVKWNYIGSLRKKEKFIISILLITLLMTMSRSSMLGMFLGILVLTLLMPSNKLRLMNISLFVFFIGLIIIMINPDIASRYTTMFDTDRGDVFVRFIQYYTAISMIEDNFLIGVGAGNYMNYIDKYNSFTGGSLIPHNSLLEIAAESGIVAVLLFMIFIYQCIRWMMRIRSIYSYMAMGALICTLTMGMFYSNIYYQLQFFVFMSIAGAGNVVEK